MTLLRWGTATDTGLVRTINQDNLLALETLFAVADGMGGHVAGEVASQVAIVALRKAFEDHDESRPTGDDLVAAVHEANDAVFARAQADSALRGMGTTMTAAALVEEDGEERLAVANVGDSRAYVFTQSELTQLTEDHSVAEELVRQGQLDPKDVDTHPQRHILTRAMGIQPDVDVDLWEILPLVGDRLLLCSDGLVREVTDDQIASVLRRLADPAEAATELIARARAGGGSDNITVVVVDVVDDDDRALKASALVTGDAHADAPARTTLGSPGRPLEVEPAPGEPDGEDGEAARHATAKFPRVKKRRRTTLRVVLFIILIGVVLGGAGVAVVAYARGSYFVTLGPAGTAQSSALSEPDSRPILVYQGRPGGLLWFTPTLAERTQFTSSEVCPVRLPDLVKGKITTNLADANRYVSNLVQEATQTCAAGTGPASPAPTTTTQTLPSPTTSRP